MTTNQTSPAANVAATPIHAAPQGATTTQPTIEVSTPIRRLSAGSTTTLNGQRSTETHATCAVEGQTSPQVSLDATSMERAPVGDQAPPTPAIPVPATRSAPPGLADPFLALAADVVDDLETVRIANENRLRQLTRDETDADGEERGFGLTLDHPDVARLNALVDMLGDAEHRAVLNLQKVMRQHPLGPWVKATKGVGEKQAARLLAAVGDPYWNDLHDRPRTVSELWAYCGLHVLRAGDHPCIDAQVRSVASAANLPASQLQIATHGVDAGGASSGSNPGQAGCDAQTAIAGVAPKRQRGQRANWSTTAKTRVYLIAASCIKNAASPYRGVYDQGRTKYADATHPAPCARCGPSGNPAQPGSPLSAGHQHARAMRLVMKEFLQDLWREAKRIHEAAD